MWDPTPFCRLSLSGVGGMPQINRREDKLPGPLMREEAALPPGRKIESFWTTIAFSAFSLDYGIPHPAHESTGNKAGQHF